MAKKEWTDPHPNLKAGGNLMRRAEQAPKPEKPTTVPRKLATKAPAKKKGKRS